MRIHDGSKLYSPSDLVAFLGCEHRSTLDLRRLAGWEQQPAAPDAAAALVQRYGDLHERAHLARLQQDGRRVVTIERDASLLQQTAATRRAMTEGADVIYQAALLRPPFAGYADFLMRVPGASSLGDYHYELADTKLARSNRAKFMVQLGVYADLLVEEQGRLPERLHVVLGPKGSKVSDKDENKEFRRTADIIHYVRAARARFLQFVQAPPQTQAVPGPACGQCGWREHCNAQWDAADHLSRVANIRSDQVAKLESAGITTLRALARTTASTMPGIGREVLDRLKRQAALQNQPLDADGRRRVELRAAAPGAGGKPSGFALLPEPDPGDLYFDMEGFPHEPGGLEYLFGVGYFEQGDRSQWVFRAFWAHDRQAEKQAFEQFMDFVEERLRRFPGAHIYHYASYEKTALQRLASQHDTRAEMLDRLLRAERLVDLYRVVSGALLLALPSYSIKKVEAYYRGQREGAVVSAGDSIVQYEAFRVSTDGGERAGLLRQIEDYNHDDVQSTQQLHDWLETLRPAELPRRAAPAADAGTPSAKDDERLQREQAAKAALADWTARQPEAERAAAARFAAILGQLLGFYRRAKLPYWWRHFDRMEKEPEELLDDVECLAGLQRQGDAAVERQSLRYTYRVPAQESKLSTGASVTCLTDGLRASSFVYDEAAGLASFTRRRGTAAPPDVLTLALKDDIDAGPKLEAIHRYVAQVCGDSGTPMDAVRRLLSRELPGLRDVKPGDPVSADASVAAVTQAVLQLEHSHLAIQGPPGTGKTTTAAAVIAALLARGMTVGVTSNSHAAINNLLNRAWACAQQAGLAVAAAAVRDADDLLPGIRVLESRDLDAKQTPLAGGTAWLFCRPEQAGRWDYLFIDEASQVSLADVVALGAAARNIVLLGDQMQLPQPVEGTHPGDSGLSALDYLMQGHATVPPEQGIFLGQSHRMHPDVCGPVSEGVYEGLLSAANACSRQRLLLDPGADTALRPTGVYWVPVVHQHCRQRSTPEAQRIAALIQSLLQQRWVNRDGVTAPITLKDILIVAPYNAQVRLLRDTLGTEARIGTVDKFQGQEAAVAILSMTTSDAESMPRGFDFLFSRNRLNVGVSRAKCLALIVASPTLRTAVCERVEDVPLLNFYALVTRIS